MITKIKENVFQLSFSKFGSCIYLVLMENDKIIIDTSSKENQEELLKDLQELKIEPEEIKIVLLTHNHWDHTSNLSLFSSAKVYDANNIEKMPIKKIKTIKTPGHSKDSLSFLYKDVLFSGDTLFYRGGRGRTDLPGGSEPAIIQSIKKLKKIKFKILCPGHI